MPADLSLENRALKNVVEKSFKPAIKRELVSYLTALFTMSIRPACGMLSLSRTVFRYQPDKQGVKPVIQRLTEAAERYTYYSLKKLFRCLADRGTPGTTSVYTGFTVW